MEYQLLVGKTDGNGNLTITNRISRPMRLVKVRWISGDFVDGVDATLANAGLGSVVESALSINDRILLTLTDANVDGWYDIDEEGGGLVDQSLKLTVTNGGAYKAGGCIAYFDPSPASNLAAPQSYLQTKLFDSGENAITNANPLQVQTPQLTDANDAVRANAYVRAGGAWVSEKRPNMSHPHQNAALANNATSIVVTTAQAGSSAFTVHQFTLFSTIAGNFSLFNGTPNGTVNLLARFGVAANSQFTFDFEGLIAVSAGNGLVLRNDTGSSAAIVAQTNINNGV